MNARKKLGAPIGRRNSEANHIGGRIRDLLQKEKISRIELSKKIKIGRNYISGAQILYRMETQKSPLPKLDHLIKIADYFKVSLDWLIKG